MASINEELITMMNQALLLEHAAYNQYLAHAELVKGLYAEKIIERIKEIASDEKKHAEKFRDLIGNYLYGEPTMLIGETHKAKDIDSILKINLQDEKTAIDFYKQIYNKIVENKNNLPYTFVTLEHEIRHIILDEEEHVAEISVLLGL